ncbi:MAG: hypothetical protein AB7G11_16405 [Phycisphaerales bacterium]
MLNLHSTRLLASRLSLIVAATLGISPAALAQTEPPATDADAATKTARVLMPADEAVPPALDDQERLLRRVRHRYLGTMRKTEIRQIGIAKLREFTDPLIFPKMLEIFRRERDDVRAAVLDHFADQKSQEGDATLAWCAVFDENRWMRSQASDRLVKRVEQARQAGRESRAAAQTAPAASAPPAAAAPVNPSASSDVLFDPDVSWRIKKIISNGLLQKSDTVCGAAAELAENLNLVEAIPQMINLQVQTPGANSVALGERGGGALAYIQIGTQQAFVSDLTPVVGDSAVAFDPTVSVLTEGTVLRIDDAVVTTYRTIIHFPLVRLANKNWDGRDTKPLAFDQRKWADWYTREFRPYREQLAAGRIEPGK